MTRRRGEGVTLVEVVKERLHLMFVQLAEEIGSGELGLDLTEEEAAGVPLALFVVEDAMRRAFARFVCEGEDE